MVRFRVVKGPPENVCILGRMERIDVPSLTTCQGEHMITLIRARTAGCYAKSYAKCYRKFPIVDLKVREHNHGTKDKIAPQNVLWIDRTSIGP